MRANEVPSESYLRYLRSLGGDVMPFPQKLNADPAYWRDTGHLNMKGCRLMSEAFVRHERSEGRALDVIPVSRPGQPAERKDK